MGDALRETDQPLRIPAKDLVPVTELQDSYAPITTTPITTAAYMEKSAFDEAPSEAPEDAKMEESAPVTETAVVSTTDAVMTEIDTSTVPKRVSFPIPTGATLGSTVSFGQALIAKIKETRTPGNVTTQPTENAKALTDEEREEAMREHGKMLGSIVNGSDDYNSYHQGLAILTTADYRKLG